MNSQTENPLAFPHDGGPGSEGMTLRDYFAAKTLEGELACQSEADGVWRDSGFQILAKRCYFIADAMLKERNQPK